MQIPFINFFYLIIFSELCQKYTYIFLNLMKTNNENWYGNSHKPNSGAGREGKPFEKRDVKSILKGNRGAARNNFDKPQFDENRNQNYNNESRGNYYDRNSNGESRNNYYERNNGEGRNNYYDRNNGENRNNYYDRNNSEGRSNYHDRNNGESRNNYYDRNNSGYGNRYDNQSQQNWQQNRPPKKRFSVSGDDQQPQYPSQRKRFVKKPGQGGDEGYIETRFDNNQQYGGGRPRFRKPYDNGNNDYQKKVRFNPYTKFKSKKLFEYQKETPDPTKPIRLNKYLANAGICSRREADDFIKAGVITVNGQVVSEMGVKVLITDNIMFHNQPVKSEKKVYILLNKPKDCVTTVEDTHDRKTVLDLVKNACSERVYPVGRLDRNTTGVLLITNDGDLASKMTHPKYEKKKIYQVKLDKNLSEEDFQTILSGIALEDGDIAADALSFVKEGDLSLVGIEIHSGKNRIVRRIFEKLNYRVLALDRVFFAGLTKKGLPRGKYRFLNDREVSMLKAGAYE